IHQSGSRGLSIPSSGLPAPGRLSKSPRRLASSSAVSTAAQRSSSVFHFGGPPTLPDPSAGSGVACRGLVCLRWSAIVVPPLLGYAAAGPEEKSRNALVGAPVDAESCNEVLVQLEPDAMARIDFAARHPLQLSASRTPQRRGEPHVVAAEPV